MKKFYKLLKQPFFGRFMVEWRNPLTEEAKKDWQRIETPSKSGGTIIGLFAHATTDAAKATIVLGHPMGKEAKAYFIKNGYTDLLRQHGYNVVVFDMNGFGESTHGSFAYYEDVVAIGQKAKTLTPDLRIGYMGVSLGGQWATIAFADPTHVYDAAIVESASTTLDEFWVNYPTAYRALKVFNALLPRYSRQIKMVERIKEAKNLKSVLFIYSKTDAWTPFEMGERFKKNCAVPSELWAVESAEHAMIMKSEYRAAYEAKIVDYFDMQLQSRWDLKLS